jgi:hypothetical protein
VFRWLPSSFQFFGFQISQAGIDGLLGEETDLLVWPDGYQAAQCLVLCNLTGKVEVDGVIDLVIGNASLDDVERLDG